MGEIVEKIIYKIADFTEEHPILNSISISSVASLVTTVIMIILILRWERRGVKIRKWYI